MIKGRSKVSLTPEAVLQRISEYDIFRMYMPAKNWKINLATHSPFREDIHPSLIIGNRYGFLYFIDYADTKRRGNCFQFVQQLFNLATIDDVLKVIDKDFGLGISTGTIGDYKKITSEYKQPEEITKRYSLVQVKTRKFNTEELKYWNSYHQDIEDLRKENIFSIDKVYLNKRLFHIPKDELRFAYLYEGGHWKIYRPFADKKLKWLPNNVPITAIDGKENIINCDVAFINKSKKDYMVMKKLIPTSCAVQNEGIACFSDENIQFLKSNSKKQILSFDSDEVGVKNSQHITQIFDFDYCNVPKEYLKEGIKDWADLAKEKGMDVIEQYLKQKQIL